MAKLEGKLGKFEKKKASDKVQWASLLDEEGQAIMGRYMFTFDGKKVYDLFNDYPKKLSDEELTIFDKENPDWKQFFGR